MFDYPPKTEDELELKKGQIISVINKVCVRPPAQRYWVRSLMCSAYL